MRVSGDRAEGEGETERKCERKRPMRPRGEQELVGREHTRAEAKGRLTERVYTVNVPTGVTQFSSRRNLDSARKG